MDVDATALSGTWFRHIPAGADVHYQPPDPADNRWQRGAVVDALYFADSERTAWAEWYRHLAEAGLTPSQGLPRPVGEQLQHDGWQALVSASAARPEGRALCVFRTELIVPGTRPVPPPATVTDPPVVPSGLRT